MSLIDTSVFIVDDDELVRELLGALITSVGLKVESFSSAQMFLDTFTQPNIPCCLVSDIRMPGLSGLDLQDQLLERGFSIPIIFISGYGTVPISVRAMKSGAIDFLQKPFENQELLDIIHRSLDKNKQEQSTTNELNKIRKRLKNLTKREQEVLNLVLNGTLNKQIAITLHMSESTVKTHRRHIMQKMEIGSLAELVRTIEKVKADTYSLPSKDIGKL
ncbi:MAG: response regulator transcription factor [Gammaproteobacteria bacterium]|nr:response regulator transcription factor [Gammaproteobacteria bacterium]